MALRSSTLAWKILWTEEPGRLQSVGLLRVRHDWVTSLSCIGEGNGNPLQCSCLENPRDRGVWWAAVYEVMHSWAQLKWLSSSSSYLEANMVPYSRSFSSDFCFCYAMMNDTKLLVGKSLGSLWIKPLYKKDLHDPDNHDGVITHLEPDILECEVKWALGSITRTKLEEVKEIQLTISSSVKVLHSICQQIWKIQQWPQDWKRSVPIPIPKKGDAKECLNYRTIALISHAQNSPS